MVNVLNTSRGSLPIRCGAVKPPLKSSDYMGKQSKEQFDTNRLNGNSVLWNDDGRGRIAAGRSAQAR